MRFGIGLDITARCVRIVRVARVGAQFQLLGLDEQPYDAAQADGLGRALSSLRRRLQINEPVVLGLSASTVILSTLNPLVVNKKRAELAVAFEMQQQLPFDLSQAAWHYHWLSPVPAAVSISRLSVQPVAVAAAVKRQLLFERLALCRRCGFQIGAVCIDTVALLNACALQRSALRTKALSLLRRLSPTAGQWIFSLPDRLEVVPVSAAEPGQFFEEAAATWKAVQSQWPLAMSVWAVDESDGPANGLSGLSGQMGVAVNVFDPAQILLVRSIRPEMAAKAAAAIGLALQGLKAAGIPLNMLAEMQQVAGNRWLGRLCLSATAVFLASALFFSAGGMLKLRRREATRLVLLQARLQQYEQLRPAIRLLLRKQQHTEGLIAQLDSALAASPLLARALAEAVKVLPDTVWLTRVECAKNGLVELTLEGRAASFQEVTHAVDKLKALDKVTLVRPLSTTVVPAPAIAAGGPGSSADGADSVAFVVQMQRKGEL